MPHTQDEKASNIDSQAARLVQTDKEREPERGKEKEERESGRGGGGREVDCNAHSLA